MLHAVHALVPTEQTHSARVKVDFNGTVNCFNIRAQSFANGSLMTVLMSRYPRKKAANFKIKCVFGDNPSIKMASSEPFTNDSAFMLKQ